MSLFLPVKKHVPIRVHDPVYSTCILVFCAIKWLVCLYIVFKCFLP